MVSPFCCAGRYLTIAPCILFELAYAPCMEADQNNLTLVLGGAASGKSVWAEDHVAKQGVSRVYLATAQAWDAEMCAKLTQHRARRDATWRTVEVPMDLPAAVAGVRPGEVVLVDCLTLWLSNLLLADADLDAAEAALLAALRACPAPVTCVSNEVGMGVVPDTPLGRRFREAQGGLNRRVAAEAGLVVAVMAGLPLVLKGQIA